MDMRHTILTAVEKLFPLGTSRRVYVDKIGKPVARALGFPVFHERPESGYSDTLSRFQVVQNSKGGDKDYWEALINFLRVKLALFLSGPENALEFPVCEKPLVSILLLTFNKAEYTLQCLETIKANTNVPYEIIIVDNSSTDFTPALLERIKNAKIIMNKENMGFLRGCNQGALHTKGNYILFLNNDTQLLPQTISKLISTIESDKKIGCVGGKLIYPDGKLQEAGYIIWKDGTTFAYGRGDDPFKPDYCHPRDIYYCSGALLLTPRELFFELGKFDELFAPAYYEDADYCMKVHEKGYRVVYQPDSVLIHYEHGSSNLSQAAKKVARNKEKFSKKWSFALSSFYPPSPENLEKAKDYAQIGSQQK